LDTEEALHALGLEAELKEMGNDTVLGSLDRRRFSLINAAMNGSLGEVRDVLHTGAPTMRPPDSA